MPEADGAVVIPNMPPGPRLSPRSPLFQHHFVGGNTLMLNLFRTYGEELGLTARSEQLDATLARTLQRLEDKTARLSIGQARLDGDKLILSVEVSSSAGHKFPTGFPSRRAWLHVTVTDAGVRTVFESGAPRPNGSIVGCDADDDEGAYEPHHERITNADQVQIYETVMQNSDGEVTYTLLRGASYAKDNRLLPAGFDKGTAPQDIAVLGAAAQDEDFAEGADRVQYEIDVQSAAAPLTVSVELLYQSLSFRFATDLRQEGTELVEQFIRFYDDMEKVPVRVVSDRKTVR